MKHRKYLIIIFLSTLALMVVYFGTTYAKYVYKEAHNYYLQSKGFYFTSDYLDVNTKQTVNNYWDGSSVYFNIKNNINESIVTDYDINYKVKCTTNNANATCNLNGTGKNEVDSVLKLNAVCENNTSDGVDTSTFTYEECSSNGYTWNNKVVSEEMHFDIVGDDISRVNVNLEISSISPYKKTLVGKFILNKVKTTTDIDIKYKDYSEYGILNLRNNSDTTKCVVVSFDPNNLLVNEYNTAKSYTKNSDNYIDSLTISINSSSSANYKFYKKNNATYDASSFTIVDTDC